MKKKILYLSIILALIFSADLSFAAQDKQTQVYQCAFNLKKAPVWQNYDVHFFIYSIAMGKTVEVILPTGDMAKRVNFSCVSGDKVTVSATYAPSIWSDDKGRRYDADMIWRTPYAVPSDTQAYVLSVCFSENFKSAQIPPGVKASIYCGAS